MRRTLSVQKPMVECVRSVYMSARGLPVNLSMRSPQAIMPALIPAPAERMNDCVQPAGMVATVDLTPAPNQVAPCARPQP